jgi:catalase (peroxidase I)
MSKFGDYDAVREDIKKILKQPEYDDGSAGPVLVRLAWYTLPSSSHPLLLPCPQPSHPHL